MYGFSDIEECCELRKLSKQTPLCPPPLFPPQHTWFCFCPRQCPRDVQHYRRTGWAFLVNICSGVCLSLRYWATLSEQSFLEGWESTGGGWGGGQEGDSHVNFESHEHCHVSTEKTRFQCLNLSDLNCQHRNRCGQHKHPHMTCWQDFSNTGHSAPKDVLNTNRFHKNINQNVVQEDFFKISLKSWKTHLTGKMTEFWVSA